MPSARLHSPWIHTMLRCVKLAAAFSVFALALPASAQMPRNFPATALRGELQFLQPPEVLLNGQPARLAPGARIRGQNNMLQMSAGLFELRATVHYTVEPSGLLLDVWILTPTESAVRPWPTSAEQAKAWLFDPAGQTWSKP
jgi:hypothetical protein